MSILRRIRTEYDGGGISQRALAREYGVGQQTVFKILHNKIWKNI